MFAALSDWWGSLSGPNDRLLKAVTQGNAADVDRLLHEGAEVNALGNRDFTPLIGAAAIGSIRIIKTLLSKGADVNKKTKDGHSALLLAAAQGHSEVVYCLLEKGADPNIATDDGTTPIILAAGNGDHRSIHLLLGAGADIEAKLKVSGASAIMAVLLPILESKRDFYAALRKLLEHGADTNLKTRVDNCDTALCMAAGMGDLKATRLLLDFGADVDVAREDGHTPLTAAVTERHWEIARLLVARGADRGATMPDGLPVSTFVALYGDDRMKQGVL